MLFLGICGPVLSQQQDPVIPNVFSPNGDHINDVFIIDGLSGSWTLRIFDRWGNLVYASENAAEQGWDGHNMIGNEVINGVYFYTLSDENSGKSYKGYIHLFR